MSAVAEHGILFRSGMGLNIEAYTDVDPADSVLDKRSTSGIVPHWRKSSDIKRQQLKCGSKVEC